MRGRHGLPVRFSKTALADNIRRRMAGANLQYRDVMGRDIDPDNGTAQVRGAGTHRHSGRGAPAMLHYGYWSALRDLLDEVEG